MNDAEVAQRLLAWLRDDLDCPSLDYAEAPQRFAWGVDAALYAFTLEKAPASHRGPLVLRLFPPGARVARARREAAIQRAVLTLGYGAPEPRSWGTLDANPLRPFVVMERLPGRTFMEVTMWSCAAALTASVFGVYVGWGVVAVLYVGVMVRWMRRLHALPTEQVAAELERAGLAPVELSIEARLDGMAARIGELGVGGLTPGLEWLREHLPEPEAEVMCHGDFWPGNILCSRRGIGVIDWGDAALAPREYELAWSEVAFYSGLPVAGPNWFAEPLAALSRPLVWLVLSLYRAGYGALEHLDLARMRYFTAFHCLRALVFAAERRALAASNPEVFSAVHPWTAPRVVELLEARFEALTGVATALPAAA